MTGITNDFEGVKVRVLCSVCRSQICDSIEFSFDEQAKFNHQTAMSVVQDGRVALR